MKKTGLFLALALISNCVLAQNNNPNNKLLAKDENTNSINTNTEEKVEVTKTIQKVTPSNLVFTKAINNLPEDAITYTKDFAQNRKNYITGIYKLGKTYFPKINKIFAKHNIPSEVNVLIAIESYFNKDCVSKSHAVGYWQFLDATAVEFGLNISDSTKDDRKDFVKSTTAAAKYLKTHYKMFNDWYLTVASYNCGGGTLRKAMAKTGKSKPTFFDVKPFLPKETQNYVMKYIALNLIYKNYNSFLSSKIKWTPTTETITIKELQTVVANPLPVN
jgi:membrane-bound lytic murein transglycosylase D